MKYGAQTWIDGLMPNIGTQTQSINSLLLVRYFPDKPYMIQQQHSICSDRGCQKVMVISFCYNIFIYIFVYLFIYFSSDNHFHSRCRDITNKPNKQTTQKKKKRQIPIYCWNCLSKGKESNSFIGPSWHGRLTYTYIFSVLTMTFLDSRQIITLHLIKLNYYFLNKIL